MAGYSGTPLVKKLGIKSGFQMFAKDPPQDFGKLIGGLPEGVKLHSKLSAHLDYVHVFTKSQSELAKFLPKAKKAVAPAGMIWVSWPKKSSKIETDITEDVIRKICLPMDLVDVKVCAVDETWSGLKLVIRKEKR